MGSIKKIFFLSVFVSVLQAQTTDIKMNGIGNNQDQVMPIKKLSVTDDKTAPGLADLGAGRKIPYIPNRWYVFENIQNEGYWDNVYKTRLILQMDAGHTLNDEQVRALLAKYEIDSVLGKSMFPDLQNFYELYVPNGSKDMIVAIATDFKALDFVNFIEPSAIVKTQGCNPNDTYWPYQWGPYAVRADSVYCYFTGPTRQMVAVIDDAVQFNHPDLINIVRYGYDYVYDDNDPSPDNPSSEHGTHVTGIVGADINNGIGVAGMLNDTIYFAKTSDAAGNLSNAAILNAINYMATNFKIRTYNMSFGSSSPWAAEETAINNTYTAGKLPIASAGNDATSALNYPSAYSNVVSVSAIGVDWSYNYVLASYSNFGSTIDISAPGGESATGFGIRSTLPVNTYGDLQGTSMASPMVTGVAGLIFAINPFLTPAQARSILLNQTFEMGSPGYDIYYGNGMTCAFCAFEEACMQMNVTISAAGSTSICNGGSVTLNAPYNFNVDYQWRRNGVDIPGATSNSYVATQAGAYNVVIQSLAGCQNITGNITVSITPDPVAGFTYATSGNTVNFTNTSANGTSYSWNFGDSGSSTATNPSHTYTSAGTYTVVLTVTNACGTHTFTQTVNVQSSTGYEDIDADEISMQVYPNPATDVLTIRYLLENTHEQKIALYNNLGQVMYTANKQDIAGTCISNINLEGFAPGIYFVEVSLSGKTFTKKIIKK